MKCFLSYPNIQRLNDNSWGQKHVRSVYSRLDQGVNGFWEKKLLITE